MGNHKLLSINYTNIIKNFEDIEQSYDVSLSDEAKAKRHMSILYFQNSVNLECAKKSFFYTGPLAWNSIPQSIKDARSVVAFKKRLKKTQAQGLMEEQYLGSVAKLDSYCRLVTNSRMKAYHFCYVFAN